MLYYSHQRDKTDLALKAKTQTDSFMSTQRTLKLGQIQQMPK